MRPTSSIVRHVRTAAVAGLLAVPCGTPAAAAGQQPLTLEQAVSLALSRGPTVAMARADSAASAAMLSQARSIPNPTATAQHTKSTPRHHFEVEQPLPLPWTRSARVAAAASGRDAATVRLDLERALVAHDVEVAYLLASAAERRRDLSALTAGDALQLVRIASTRAEAGDAAELEVALARVAAGGAVSQAASDSLYAVTSLLELQRLVGEPVDRVTVRLADSLAAPGPVGAAGTTRFASTDSAATPLAVSAAHAEVQAAEASLTLARRGRLPGPSLVAGFESHDPSGGEPGTLPLFGVVLSIPLFNQGGGEVAQARAELDLARGALRLAERETAAAVADAGLRRTAARARLARSLALLGDAERIAALSGRAYEEGAFPLTSVLEAQRSARDARLRYVEDVAAARIADADYELATRARRDR